MNQQINVTESQIKSYIECFFSTLRTKAAERIPQVHINRVKHMALLPSKITCYISTQFGVAFEYEQASVTSIETMHGSARVEDLLLMPPKHLAKQNHFIGLGGAGIALNGVSTRGAYPFRLERKEASVFIQDATFESKGWKRYVRYAEVYGNRECEYWAEARAMERAYDEIFSVEMDMKQAELLKMTIPEYLSQFKEKQVLLLGSYKPDGMERLSLLSIELRRRGYNVILLKDVPNRTDQTLDQKVITIANMVRFVVVDDTVPSGHISELKLCEQVGGVVVIMRLNGKASSAMTRSLTLSSNLMKAFEYSSDSVGSAIDGAVEWAEVTLSTLRAELKTMYRDIGG